MLSFNRVRRVYGDHICRACLNREYRLHLQRKDCKYGYKYVCPCCREDKNIVVGLTFLGKLKTLGRF